MNPTQSSASSQSLMRISLHDLRTWLVTKEGILVAASLLAIVGGILLRIVGLHEEERLLLTSSLALCGIIIGYDLLRDAVAGQFSSDFLAGISIVTATLLHEYWAAVLVVFMLSGGQSLERFAMRNASAILAALAQRMPHHARRRVGSKIEEISLDNVQVGDVIEIHPHDICPVDGVVIEGRSSMDEAFLTGEPYVMPKVGGSTVISGAINGIHGTSGLPVSLNNKPRGGYVSGELPIQSQAGTHHSDCWLRSARASCREIPSVFSLCLLLQLHARSSSGYQFVLSVQFPLLRDVG
jgi:cation transport ATPase